MELGTVLVANRGEIAVRVIRTLRALGVRSVAVYSDADADARHVRDADLAVRLGPASAAQSYLNIQRIIEACRESGAEAVHPGYGFLSESAAFARALADAGIVFIGPPIAAIETMGDKIAAKAAVAGRGVPTVPGLSRPGLTDADLIAGSGDVGFPVLIKPSAGGGGKGMRRVDLAEDLPEALASARREARAAFGDDALLMERFVRSPRHIEVQVLADRHGSVIHLGERECSLQRRHQKVIEEAPSPLLDPATRERIGAAACDAARSVGYVGAGTVEFIVSAEAPEEFFFMEMNTRLQVEHPVTELVTGLDLVELQVRIAAGHPLPIDQAEVELQGHAVEARVYAEDPGRDFLPTGGTVLALAEPSGPGIRVDSGLRVGTRVGTDYDPMLAKVIAHGRDRAEALARLDAALAGTRVLGVRTNIEFCRFLLGAEEVGLGALDTGLLDRLAEGYRPAPPPPGALVAAAMHRTEARWNRVPRERRTLWDIPNGWRLGPGDEPGQGGRAEVWTRLDHGPGTTPITLGLRGTPQDAHITLTDATLGADHPAVTTARLRARVLHETRPSGGSEGIVHVDPRHSRVSGNHLLRLTLDGAQQRWLVVRAGDTFWVAGDGGTWELRLRPLIDPRIHDEGTRDGEVVSPMPGSVVACFVTDGSDVAAGDRLLAVEAMKMEHALVAPVAGTVRIHVKPGDQVTADQVLAVVEPTPGPTREEHDG